jgi:hypothetical protein
METGKTMSEEIDPYKTAFQNVESVEDCSLLSILPLLRDSLCLFFSLFFCELVEGEMEEDEKDFLLFDTVACCCPFIRRGFASSSV